MSIKDIRIFGDPVLRAPAIEVVDFDKELRQLVKDLTDTMVNAPGAGLAAPQIGVGLRVFTYHVDDELGHLINPSLDLSSEMQDGEEGCLSFPGIFFDTPRALRLVAKGFDQYGEPVVREGTELLARCIRHPVHRPHGQGAAQAGDEGDPRCRVGGSGGADRQGQPARHLRYGSLSWCGSSLPVLRTLLCPVSMPCPAHRMTWSLS